MVQTEPQQTSEDPAGPTQAARRIVRCRASGIPRLIDCSQSGQGDIRIDDDRYEARLGSAVHVVADRFIADRRMPELDSIASHYRIKNDKDFEFLCRSIVQAWESELAKKFPGPLVEQRMSIPLHSDETTSVYLTGHPDVVSLTGPKSIRIIDWKSGRRQDDFRLQLMSYGLLAKHFYHADAVTGTVVWLRERKCETFKFVQNQFNWLEKAIVDALLTPGDYRIGDYCVTCPRFSECPARHQLCAATQATILTEGEAAACNLDADRLHKLRTGIKCLKSACERCEEQIKAEVRHAGHLSLPNGRSLVFRSRTKRDIDSALAWPVIREYLPAHVATSATTIGITALKQAVMDSQLSGQKSKTWKDLCDRLEQVGAMTIGDTPYLTETDNEQ